MAWQLRALVVWAEKLELVLSTHVAANNHPYVQLQGSNPLFWALLAPGTHVGKTFIPLMGEGGSPLGKGGVLGWSQKSPDVTHCPSRSS